MYCAKSRSPTEPSHKLRSQPRKRSYETVSRLTCHSCQQQHQLTQHELPSHESASLQSAVMRNSHLKKVQHNFIQHYLLYKKLFNYNNEFNLCRQAFLTDDNNIFFSPSLLLMRAELGYLRKRSFILGITDILRFIHH